MLRKTTLLASLVLALSLGGAAPKEARKAQVIKYMKESLKALQGSTKGLTDAQWTYKPAADKWSIAQTVKHLILTEKGFAGMIQQKMMKEMADAETLKKAKERKDADIYAMIQDRGEGKKFKTTEMFEPGEVNSNFAALLTEVQAERKKTMDFIMTVSESDFEKHAMTGPPGTMDALGWLAFEAAHMRRHTAQILEVKASAGFPKK